MARDVTAEALLARGAEGDESALGQLVDRYAPVVLALLRRRLAGQEAAEEVLACVFERLRAEASRLARARVSVPAWLVVAACAGAQERRVGGHRRHGRTGRKLDLLARRLDWVPRPEEIARLDQRRELLKRVTNQLPKPQRAILELAALDGCNEDEISEKLGEP